MEPGGAAAHAAKSGVSHFTASDDRACLGLLRTLLSFMPSKRIRFSDVHEHEFLDETPSKSTTLMFKEDFARKLIDFGYDDARNKHSELKAFFRRDRRQDTKRYAQYVR